MILPHTEIVLQNKRTAKILDWLKVKRSKNRQDVYMEQLKNHAGKQIWDLTDWDVVEYLTWKDTNSSGRTLVHHKDCGFLGTNNTERCEDNVLCSYRHAAESLRVGIVQKVRQAGDDENMRGPFMYATPRPTKPY